MPSSSIQRGFVVGLLLSLAAALCLEQAKLAEQLLARHANEAQAVLWQAAADWARPDVREPQLYAQPYGLALEAIPVALLHALGIDYGAGVPIALVSLGVLAWVVLVCAALRGGYLLPAIVAAALPLLLDVEHWVVLGASVQGVSRLLAASGAALALAYPSSRAGAFFCVASSGVAVMTDPSTIILVGPVAVWWAWRALRTSELREPAVLGLLPPAALQLVEQWVAQSHADLAPHVSPSFHFEASALSANFAAPDRLLGPQALELYPHASSVWVVLALLWIGALALRAFRELAGVSCLMAVLTAVAAQPASLEAAGSLWSSSACSTLTTPMALWFAFAVTWRAASERLEPRFGVAYGRAQLAALVLVLGVCAWTVTHRMRHWDARLAVIEATGVGDAKLPVRKVDDLLRLCAEAERAMVMTRSPIVVFPYERAATYACPAVHSALVTLDAESDRRFSVLRQLSAKPVESLLLWGVPPETCKKKRIRRSTKSCKPMLGNQALIVRFDPRSALDVVRALGFRS